MSGAIGCAGEVAWRGDVVCLRPVMLSRRGYVLRQIEAHRQIAERRHIERHRIADRQRTGGNGDRGRSTERQHPIGARVESMRHRCEGHVSRADDHSLVPYALERRTRTRPPPMLV